MKRTWPTVASTQARRRDFFRPQLEQLEDRLPTGVMLGLLAGPWAGTSLFLLDQLPSAADLAVVERLPETNPSEQAGTGFTEQGNPGGSEVVRWWGGEVVDPFILHHATTSLPHHLTTERAEGDVTLPSLAALATALQGRLASGASPVSGEPGITPSVTGAAPGQLLLEAIPAALAGQAMTSLASASVSSHLSLGPSSLSTETIKRAERPSEDGLAGKSNKSQILENYGRLPLRFEMNQGQTDAQVQFVSPSSAYTLFLTGSEAVLRLHQPATPASNSAADAAPPAGAVLHMQVVGANAGAQAVGREELPGKVNYLLGNDPARWHTDIPTYAKVEYRQVYAGINLVYYSNQQQLEYDFNVAPGADPGTITLGFTGSDRLEIDAQGDLLLHTASGPVRQHKPVVYQEVNGVRQEIAGGYVLKGTQQVGFQVGTYDLSRTLVIDPVLAYSTYLGGSTVDVGNAITVDAGGNAYVTGDTTSTDFPTANPFQPGYGGGASNAFVTKLDPTGTLLYSTFLGGEGFDRGNGIAVDSTGSAYVVGKTNSRMFPITQGAFEDSYRGDEFDGFVTKLNPAGDGLSYSTYLGGRDNDAAIAVAVDASGDAYVTGGTKSTDFPVTLNAYQNANSGGLDAFVTELNPAGTGVLYSTFLGGSSVDRGNGIAVDSKGYVYVTGQTKSDDFPTRNAVQPDFGGGGAYDAFVTKLDPRAFGDDSLIYSTYLGGSADDKAFAIAIDVEGNAVVTGETSSADFPTMNPLQPALLGLTNAFVAKLNSTGNALIFSTYLGGTGADQASSIALDAGANIYLTGSTTSSDFPTMNPIQPDLGGGSDAFVTKLNAAGTPLVFSTYLGGSDDENPSKNGENSGAIAVDPAGNVYVTGTTASTDFPTVNPLQQALRGLTNAFIAKISDLG